MSGMHYHLRKSLYKAKGGVTKKEWTTWTREKSWGGKGYHNEVAKWISHKSVQYSKLGDYKIKWKIDSWNWTLYQVAINFHYEPRNRCNHWVVGERTTINLEILKVLKQSIWQYYVSIHRQIPMWHGQFIKNMHCNLHNREKKSTPRWIRLRTPAISK